LRKNKTPIELSLNWCGTSYSVRGNGLEKCISLVLSLTNKGGADMYALIYDEFDLAKREKSVISVNKSRETAEKALKKRQQS
jgi:hypothetical protein